MSLTYLEFLHSFRFGPNDFVIEDFPSTTYIVGLLTPLFLLIILFILLFVTTKFTPTRYKKNPYSTTILCVFSIIITSLTIVICILISQSDTPLNLLNEQFQTVQNILKEIETNYSRTEIVSIDYDQVRDFNTNANRDCNIALTNIANNFNLSLPEYEGNVVESAINEVENSFSEVVILASDVFNSTKEYNEYFTLYLYLWEVIIYFLVFLFFILLYTSFLYTKIKLDFVNHELNVATNIVYVVLIIFVFLTCIINIALGSTSMFGSDICIPNVDDQVKNLLQFIHSNDTEHVCTVEPFNVICDIQTCENPNSLPIDDLDTAVVNLNFIDLVISSFRTTIISFDNSTIEAVACNIQLRTLNDFFEESRYIVQDSIENLRCNKLNAIYEIATDEVLCKHVFSHVGKIWFILLFLLLATFELLIFDLRR